MSQKVRVRRGNLDIKGRIRFITARDSTTTVYGASICDLSDHGAMVQVDIVSDDRAQLFEKIRYCILEFAESELKNDQVLAKAVWFQPQTSTGDMMSFKIGLSFEQVKEEVLGRIRQYLASHAVPPVVRGDDQILRKVG